MPAESAPQDRVWMAFPSEGYSLGDTEQGRHEARATWAAVAHAVAEFEPVTMVIDPGERAAAQRYLSADIDVVEAPLNDAWMRDMGPTFVHAEDGSVAAVDWIFNGWGAQDWAQWDRDEKIGVFVAGRAGTPVVSSALVNEGGGIQVDGEGTVLVTETVQLDPGRNPGLTRADVEAELARTIGSTHVVWLPRGLARDSEQYGTRGHVESSRRSPRRADCSCTPRPMSRIRITWCAKRFARHWRKATMPPAGSGRSSRCPHPRRSPTPRGSSTTATSTTWWSTAG